MSGDPFIAFQGTDPNDTRFQFDVIKHLSESVRQLAAGMADMQKTQVSMLERLATLEAGKVSARLDSLDSKMDALEMDKNRRDGAFGAFGALRVWLLAVPGVFTALYILGRAVGIIPTPPTTVTKIDTPVVVEHRRETIAPPPVTTVPGGPQ